MKAILQSGPGPASTLSVGEIEIPKPKDNEVLIRITHTALNRADIL
jgi:NADPH:quinone reductase-like Zn-dependent oxidoreductase